MELESKVKLCSTVVFGWGMHFLSHSARISIQLNQQELVEFELTAQATITLFCPSSKHVVATVYSNKPQGETQDFNSDIFFTTLHIHRNNI